MEWLYFTIIILLLVSIFIAFLQGVKKGVKDFLTMLLSGGFELRINAFREQNKYVIKGGIVFLGDSLTQEYNITEYFPGKFIYNRGIGGDTTIGLLTRLDVSVYDLEPSKIFLLIGTNDLALLNSNPKDVYENIQSIIKELKEKLPSLSIYLLSLYPVNPNMDTKTVGKIRNKDIELINQLIQTIKNVTYINVHDKLLSNDVLNTKYTREGLHLNATGYTLVTEVLRPYLES